MQKLTILCAAFLFFPLLAKADNDVPLTDTPDDSLDVWNQNLNEVVVTGQGAAVSKRRLSSNITKLSTADLEKLPTDRIDQMLQNALPNVQITMTNGQPGTTSMVKSPVSTCQS